MKLRQEEEKTAREEKSSAPADAAGTSTKNASPPLRLAVTEKPAVPCSKLTLIAAPLMKHLSGLLHSLQFMEEDLKRVRQELHQYKERTGESSENSSPAGSMRKPSASSAAPGAAAGKSSGRPGEKHGDGPKKSGSQPPPTTNIDEYLASSSASGEQKNVPKLTVQQCASGTVDEAPTGRGGKRAEVRDEIGTPGNSIPRSGSGGSVLSSADEGHGHLGLGASATTPAMSPLSNVSSPEPRPTSAPSPKTTSTAERSSSAGSTGRSSTPSAAADRAASRSPARGGGENPPTSLHIQNTRKEPTATPWTTPNSGVKSPESSGEGDEEKRRERRRQKRQRHTALSGLEMGSPRQGSLENSDQRKMSLEEEDDVAFPTANTDSPLKAVSEEKEK